MLDLFRLHRAHAAKAEDNPPVKVYTCWVCSYSNENPIDFLAHLKEVHSSEYHKGPAR